MASLPGSLVTFGQQHFGRAVLGDRRRTRSLVDLADRFARHPEGSLPAKCQDPNTLRRCYDLMNTPEVTHARVLEAHRQRTLDLICEQRGVVLQIHDTTELDFSKHYKLHDQLGQIGNGFGRGYLCHNSLAVRAHSRAVLGLIEQRLHVRAAVPPGETRAQRRERQTRESLLWLKSVDGIEEAMLAYRRGQKIAELPTGLLCVDVCDRGADTFEFLCHEHTLRRHYVIRSQHDRRCCRGHAEGGEETTLHELLRTLPKRSRRTITVGGRDGEPKRKAVVAVAWCAVRLFPPQDCRGHCHKGPLDVWALRVREIAPPKGVEPVEWFLLSSLEVTSVAEAWERVDWYCCRWMVEEFHKAQKTGCDIEGPQFTTAEALQPMIALQSVVAILLLNLREMSRDEASASQPATELVDVEYVEVLSGWRYGALRALTVREFFQALARLGGHQGRRGDGPPGWLVLWRGWSALQMMVTGARAIRRPREPSSGNSPRGGETHSYGRRQ